MSKEAYYKMAASTRALQGSFNDALYAKQWNIENKPTGFDVQDIRLGGLLRRTDSCRRRLLDYTSGKIDEIPELAFELLEGTVPAGSNCNYGTMVTPNRLSHKIV